MHPAKRRSRRLAWEWRSAAAIYVALLCVSLLVRTLHTEPQALPQGVSVVTVPAVDGERRTDQLVRIAYREYVTAQTADAPAVVLLHGSPGNWHDFARFAPQLADKYRVIVPDLPGFGASTARLPDYSFRAHARYILSLLDRLHIQRAHVVAFSMGGGVALNLVDLAPQRVESIVMLSAIGVQEMELLGDYHLNHAVHGLQLAGLWLLREGTPHMGWLDHAALGVPYARNFYDSDQRPLRGVLSRYDGPMLIVHGQRDMMVPIEAAPEHYRLVPQSELRLLPQENHFYLFNGQTLPAQYTRDFLARVDRGESVTRASADPQRLLQAAQPFDPSHLPRFRGPAVLTVISLLAAATLVSEDLTCVGAGVLAAQGRIGFALAAFACLLGIFVGDMLLFLAGRFLGRPVLKRAPLKWFIRAADVERSSAWLSRKGMTAILLSRFLPGTRLPTYFAAGLLETSFWKFSLYFFLAALVWTPLLVGLSMLLGAQVSASALLVKQSLLLKALLGILVAFGASKLSVRLASWRGRRLLLGRWRRLMRWEFWPPSVFYAPVVFYVVWLALRHKSLTLFTCANPGIPGGGFIGESKAEILQALSRSQMGRERVARFLRLKGSLGQQARLMRAREFMQQHALAYPVALKPDVGQRGSGVALVRSEEEMEAFLRDARGDTIIQEYIAGLEFGVFYFRLPGSERGRIFSITDKRFPEIEGDGSRTLEELILKDERAVCMTGAYFERHRENLWRVPAVGETMRLIEIGTHCRGAVFLDGNSIKTAALEASIDELSRGFDGFYFGRFDLRTPDLSNFQRGTFKVIELNGVTSEATHIYDPRNSLLTAYRVLFEQWRLAFEIGAENRERGIKPTSLATLVRALVANWAGEERPITSVAAT